LILLIYINKFDTKLIDKVCFDYSKE